MYKDGARGQVGDCLLPTSPPPQSLALHWGRGQICFLPPHPLPLQLCPCLLSYPSSGLHLCTAQLA
jgi:hypothetical protein